MLIDEMKTTQITPDAIKKFQQLEESEMQRKRMYGKINPIIHADFKEHKFVAVGNQMHYSRKWKTVPDFLLHYIKSALSEEWGNEEIKKPFVERHEILKWYHKMCEFQHAQVKDENGLFSATPNGFFAAYLFLAYDLYILRNHNAYQEDVIKRLKHPDQFQGARYELFVTATCVRAGFDILFEDEKDRSRKHPEFTAVHRQTGQKISVEAKSKQRKGVLGHLGEKINDEEIRLRVGGLINQALEKEADYPFVVFVDVNVPPSFAKHVFDPARPNEIFKTLDKVQKPDDGKDKFNLILFTNHPHHYGRDDEPDPSKNVLAVFSQSPAQTIAYPQVLAELENAVYLYGNIPNEFPEKD